MAQVPAGATVGSRPLVDTTPDSKYEPSLAKRTLWKELRESQT